MTETSLPNSAPRGVGDLVSIATSSKTALSSLGGRERLSGTKIIISRALVFEIMATQITGSELGQGIAKSRIPSRLLFINAQRLGMAFDVILFAALVSYSILNTIPSQTCQSRKTLSPPIASHPYVSCLKPTSFDLSFRDNTNPAVKTED